MLLNLVDDPEPPSYYQLNLGYRITPKDVLSLELITWKYYEPLGVPLSDKKTATNFLGHFRYLEQVSRINVFCGKGCTAVSRYSISQKLFE